MQQGAGRLLGDAAVTVRHAGHRTLEETENGAHAVDLVERGDEVHFRRARIGETNLDAAVHQRADKALCAVHLPCFAHAFLPAAMMLCCFSSSICLASYPSSRRMTSVCSPNSGAAVRGPASQSENLTGCPTRSS